MDIKWGPRGKSKEPAVQSSGPVASNKDPVLPVKEPVASSREPVVSASEPEAVERSPALTASDSYRASAKHAIELEVRAIIEDEIKNAAKELAEEHKMVIWAAFAENKRIIREVLDQELVAIRERIEATRQSIIRTGIR